MDQISLFPEERRNTGLLSQYYLEEILLPTFGTAPETTGQADLGDSYFREKFEILERIVRKNEELAANRSERQLEDDVIQPILREVLGHVFDVATRKKNDIPDYAFFNTEAEKQIAIRNGSHSKEFEDLNIGILDAKAWKESRKAGIANEANISQIFRYLANYSKRWGVLTDGFRWMLFCNKSGIRQDQYIEFDLSKIIQDERGYQGVNFRLFVFLFRRQAFEWKPGITARLDDVLEESIQNAERLQSDLKEKVYLALEKIAEEYRRYNHLQLDSPQKLEELKEASLIFLYRILFLLFGESRLILPIRPHTAPYYALSLESLLIDQIDRDTRPLPNGIKYWNDLQQLFQLIHGLEEDGSPSRLREDIGLPAYNGGLFDPKNYQNVSKWKLGDKVIKEVMDLLTKTGKKKQDTKPVRVSYRDLGVQHLGNIYEGILENHVQTKTDGTVEIVNDKKERKATGSYYTPDYIVDYIVHETLRPIVADAKKEKDAVEAIFRIKVLDPAMGSGHFLVGAIDYLAKELADTSFQEGIYTEAELQESRRIIAERCIYGVDLNPMAVELAKLSIWLHTISASKPLTFLDNHIKCGNALIGARVNNLAELPLRQKHAAGQKSQGLLFPKHKLEQEAPLWLAEGRLFKGASDSIEEVKAKEKLERELDERRLKYKHLADLWTASYFMEASDTDLSIIFRQIADAIVVNAEEAPLPDSEILKKALEIAKAKRFFHWELEFPEIFFDKHGRVDEQNGGFDVVIGNPPYVRQEALGETKEHYYKPMYESYSNTADLYVYFYELSERSLRQSGTFGMITSNKFMRANYGKPLRVFLAGHSALEQIIDFGELPVFAEAAPMPVILLAKKAHVDQQNFVYTQVKSLKFTNLLEVVKATGKPLNGSGVDGENWSLISREAADFREKISQQCKPLKEYVSNKVHFGIKTGYNKAFVIDRSTRDELIQKDARSAEIIRPFVLGDDVRKYHVNFENRFLIWTYIGVPIQFYPAILEHLSSFRRPEGDTSDEAFIEERQDQGQHWWELRACDYYDEFQAPKIIYPDIAKESRFTIDREGYFFSNTAYMIPAEDLYLVAILNSKLIWNIYKQYAAVLGDADKGGRLRWFTQYVEQLPIRSINSKKDKAHAGELCDLAEQMLTLNKEKQSLANDFFRWMGNYGIPARYEMKPKSALDEFWTLEFKDILVHLKKNKVKLGIGDENRLEARFKEASKALRDLDEKIANTDLQIDQIVYALYGLTEEEIAMVERSG